MTTVIVGSLWTALGLCVLLAIYMTYCIVVNAYRSLRIMKLERDRRIRMKNISDRLKAGDTAPFLPMIYQAWKSQEPDSKFDK